MSSIDLTYHEKHFGEEVLTEIHHASKHSKDHRQEVIVRKDPDTEKISLEIGTLVIGWERGEYIRVSPEYGPGNPVPCQFVLKNENKRLKAEDLKIDVSKFMELEHLPDWIKQEFLIEYI